MKTFASDHPRVVAATPGMSPGERSAMWRNGLSAEQLALMEQRSGSAPQPAPAPTSAATKPAPAPAARRALPTAVRGASGGGAPIAAAPATPTPVSPSTTPKASANPLFAAAAGAMAAFNDFHATNRDDAND
uniref:Uncharacterized protein n=1 Tax=Bosea sp. NBC_00436 TaxID=2969620 RepID=A0A9E7ZTL9_9HYPH